MRKKEGATPLRPAGRARTVTGRTAGQRARPLLRPDCPSEDLPASLFAVRKWGAGRVPVACWSSRLRAPSNARAKAGAPLPHLAARYHRNDRRKKMTTLTPIKYRRRLAQHRPDQHAPPARANAEPPSRTAKTANHATVVAPLHNGACTAVLFPHSDVHKGRHLSKTESHGQTAIKRRPRSAPATSRVGRAAAHGRRAWRRGGLPRRRSSRSGATWTSPWREIQMPPPAFRAKALSLPPPSNSLSSLSRGITAAAKLRVAA